MRGFVHLHALIAAWIWPTRDWQTWDWQAIGACLLAFDLMLFGALAAYWRNAAAQGRAADLTGSGAPDTALRLAGWKPWPHSPPRAPKAMQPKVDADAPADRAKRADADAADGGDERDRDG